MSDAARQEAERRYDAELELQCGTIFVTEQDAFVDGFEEGAEWQREQHECENCGWKWNK